MTGTLRLTGGSLGLTGTTAPAGQASAAPAVLTWPQTTDVAGLPAGTRLSVTDTVSRDEQLIVTDATGLAAGWHITATASRFSDGTRTLPAAGTLEVTGSTTSATAITAPASICLVAGSCRKPANGLSYPVEITANAGPVTFYESARGTGAGVIRIGGAGTPDPLGWWLNLPAIAARASYSGTVTVQVISGP